MLRGLFYQIGVIPSVEFENVVEALPPETVQSLSSLITILQAAGVIFIIYLVFLITNIVLNIRRNKRIKKMDNRLKEIEHKLDKALTRKKDNKKKK